MVTRSFSRFSLIMILSMGAILMGCSKPREIDPRSLQIHLPAVKLNLDPQKMEDAYSMAIVGQIYRGLLRYSTTGDVLSDIAESWTESADHLVYQFKLKDTKFSDGTPITARHVQMSFARMFRLGASMAADIDYIEGAAKFKATHDLPVFGVRAMSPRLVEFRLAKPSAIFLKQLAVVDCSILPITDFKQDPEISASGSFSGPYKIVKNLEDGTLTIGKWRRDALDSQTPPEVIRYFTSEQSPTLLALDSKTDTLDHDRVTADDRRKLESRGWASAPTELAGEIFVVLNPDTIPENVREALFESIDPAALAAELGRDSYRAAYGLIPFGLPGELSREDAASLRSHQKQPLLKKPLNLQLDYERGSELEERIALFLKKSWVGIPIEVTLNPIPKGEKLQRLFGKRSQVIIGRKAMDYPDGFSVLGYFKGNYESNYFFVNDPAIDQALTEVLQVFDAARRTEKYKALQIQILRQHTLIPLLFGSEASGLWSSKVKSVPSHPLGYHTLPLESIEMTGGAK